MLPIANGYSGHALVLARSPWDVTVASVLHRMQATASTVICEEA